MPNPFQATPTKPWSWLSSSNNPPPVSNPPPSQTPPPGTPPAGGTPPPATPAATNTPPVQGPPADFGGMRDAFAQGFPKAAAALSSPGAQQGIDLLKNVFGRMGNGGGQGQGQGNGLGMGLGGGRMNKFGEMAIGELPQQWQDRINQRWATIGGGQPMPANLGGFFDAAKTYYAANPPIRPEKRNRWADILSGLGRN